MYKRRMCGENTAYFRTDANLILDKIAGGDDDGEAGKVDSLYWVIHFYHTFFIYVSTIHP